MTIEKGRPWGRTVARPAGLVVVSGDHAAAVALSTSGGPPVAVDSGDLHRTLGSPGITGRTELVELPLDLVEVTLDDGDLRTCVAHVVARSPWWRGSWWRGSVLVVMNAEFVGDWDVAPRGHPNDGRVETQLVDAAMGVRHRLAARRRLRLGTHVPHPDITTRSVRSSSWTFETPQSIHIDGRFAARSRSVAVRVLPDAATIYA